MPTGLTIAQQSRRPRLSKHGVRSPQSKPSSSPPPHDAAPMPRSTPTSTTLNRNMGQSLHMCRGQSSILCVYEEAEKDPARHTPSPRPLPNAWRSIAEPVCTPRWSIRADAESNREPGTERVASHAPDALQKPELRHHRPLPRRRELNAGGANRLVVADA